MVFEVIKKPAFSVIGKEGSTNDGEDFIARLWENANSHFGEIEELAKRDENGCFAGFWGAMTDFSRSFMSWENGFSEGLYLAGAECCNDAIAPNGWTRWNIPGFNYIKMECEDENTFANGLAYINENSLTLAGAVHDFIDPADGKNYMMFPIKKLDI